ncbi:MAG: YgiT-type zinc finger protein [Cyanobacteriota bacterium]|nr:YgiT-type zinc finger protein [Cyanobacteriota bacterium]
MMPIERCPVCGGNVVEKEVVEVLHGGDNTAILMVDSIVCQRCGERFYSLNTVRKFEEIKKSIIC